MLVDQVHIIWILWYLQHIFYLHLFLYPVEKRKENITDLPRQGGQKKKMGEYSEEFSTKINSIGPLIIFDFNQHIFIHCTFNFTCIYLFLLERVEEKLKNHNRDLSMVSDLFTLDINCVALFGLSFSWSEWLARSY